MRKYNQKTAKGEWIVFPEDEEVQILVRPFSLFNLTRLPSEDDFNFKQFLEIYDYCVLDWKGIQDDEGKPLKCNDENKKMVFNFDQELVLFVVNESTKLRDKILTEKEVKNSETSQPGETTKQEK